jgi:phosphoribosylformylglycinamidine synthase subunit PurQ / glutaminase
MQAAARVVTPRATRGSEGAGPRPRIGVIVFPGSNDDRDAAWALAALGAEPVLVWHAEDALPRVDAVVLPGGFSYGDYLRAGAIARLAPAMRAVAAFAAEGGFVLGVCNGFQILCEAGLLPGALRPNASLEFVCRDVVVRVERADTAFTARCRAGQRLMIPVKHGDGCWFAPPDLLDELERGEQLVLRYERGDNPNGSIADVAGVVNANGNVMGLMPHPEHAIDPLLGSGDGAFILASLVDASRERVLAAA